MSDLLTFLSPEAAGCQCEDYCSCLAWHHQPWCQHVVGEACALPARQVGYHTEEAEDDGIESGYPEDWLPFEW